MKRNILLFFLLVIIFLGCSKNRISPDFKQDAQSLKDLLSMVKSGSINENPKLERKIASLISRADTLNAQFGNYYANKYVSLKLNDLSEPVETNASFSSKGQKLFTGILKKKYKIKQERLIFYLFRGKVTEIKILQIQTNDNVNSIDKYLSDIINFRKSEFNGEVIYRNLNGKFLYTIHYSKDAFGYSSLTTKSETKTSSLKPSDDIKSNTIECTDWYLITTITYIDGSQTISEDYVGTTCQNTCQSDPYSPQTFCDDITGGGGGVGEWPSDFTTTPNLKLCGQYSWTLSGGLPDGAKNTVINNLLATFSPNNNPTITLSARFADACVTIPNHCSTNEYTLSLMFNTAFNKAVSSVESRLGTNGPHQIPAGDYFVYEELKKEIQKELIIECPGSVFNNGGCTSNIARNKPKFCPNSEY